MLQVSATAWICETSIYSDDDVFCVRLAAPSGRAQSQADVDISRFSELGGLLPAIAPEISGLASSANDPYLSLAGLAARMAVELQNAAGASVTVWHAFVFRQRIYLVIGVERARMARAALKTAVELVNLALGRQEPAALKETWRTRIDQYVAEFEGKTRSYNRRLMDEAARARGIPVHPVAGSFEILGTGVYRRIRYMTVVDDVPFVSVTSARNKRLAWRFMSLHGLPLPRQEEVYDAKAAVAAAHRIGYPVVVKPTESGQGSGVAVGVSSDKAVARAFDAASSEGPSVLIESVLPGEECRIFVARGKAIAASIRVPAYVVGDGRQSVRELVEAENLRRAPRVRARALYPIELDAQSRDYLAASGRTFDTVPAKGEHVVVRGVSNLSRGGITRDVTDILHPDNRSAAESAAEAIGLELAGVDFILPDVSKSWRETGGGICEINHMPAVDLHATPVEGKSRDVYSPIFSSLFPSGICRIPAIAVVDGTSAGACSALIGHVLRHSGKTVLVTDAARGERLSFASNVEVRDIPPWLDPRVEAAVLRMDPERLLGGGIGLDRFDVLVIESVADYVNFLPECLRGLLLQRVDGTLVLDRDEPLAPDIARMASGSVSWVDASAKSPDLPERDPPLLPDVSLRAGDGGEWYVEGLAGGDGELVRINVPPGSGGRTLARHVTLAAAAARALGLDAGPIRDSLESLPTHLVDMRSSVNGV